MVFTHSIYLWENVFKTDLSSRQMCLQDGCVYKTDVSSRWMCLQVLFAQVHAKQSVWPSKFKCHVSSINLKLKHREVLTSRAKDPCVFDHKDGWVSARNSYNCYMLENIALRNFAKLNVKQFVWPSLTVYICGLHS